MTKKDIENFIKKQYIVSNADAKLIVEAFLETIFELAKEKNGVVVQNLGRFEFKEKIIEKYVRNFKDGNGEVKRTLKKNIYFTPSKTLRDL